MPGVGADGCLGLVLHGVEAVLEQLGEVAENGGAADRNAVLSQCGKQPGERVVDRGGGAEFAEDAEDFRADLGGEGVLLFAAPVVEAEMGMAFGEKHAATTTFDVGVLAEAVVGRRGYWAWGCGLSLGGHWWALSGGWRFEVGLRSSILGTSLFRRASIFAPGTYDPEPGPDPTSDYPLPPMFFARV
jgi:hypothetical protein